MAELRTLVGVDLIRVGSWEASTGAFIPTPGDLAAAVAAFDAGVLRKPILKLGHVDPRFDGEPAVGFVDHLRLSDGGRTLLGDFAAVPAWLADVMASAYPDRSIEGRYDYADPTGRVWPFLLTAVALIGVAAPAIGSLQSLQDRYGLAEPVAASFTGRAVHITTGAPRTDTPELVRRRVLVRAAATRRATRHAHHVLAAYAAPPQKG